MGLLVDGVWHDKWYDTKSTGGKFVRSESQFRNWITADGSAGPSGEAGFKAEKDRYHLYVSLACPWAHRVLIVRALKGLEAFFPVTVVNSTMLEYGWTIGPKDTPLNDGSEADPIHGADRLYQVYLEADPHYSGRVTVPAIWDKKTGTIVSNESAEIIRMLNTAFNELIPEDKAALDLYPEDLRTEIDGLNERIYHAVNNGVYKSGFATSQEAYEEAVTTLFDALDWLEDHLAGRRYLAGPRITEADWRLFTTLVRFDPVYVGHFKCNIRRIADYPNLQGYLKELFQVPGIAQTVDFDHIKGHYYRSHGTINPTGVVPKGPVLDLTGPHGREAVTG